MSSGDGRVERQGRALDLGAVDDPVRERRRQFRRHRQRRRACRESRTPASPARRAGRRSTTAPRVPPMRHATAGPVRSQSVAIFQATVGTTLEELLERRQVGAVAGDRGARPRPGSGRTARREKPASRRGSSRRSTRAGSSARYSGSSSSRVTRMRGRGSLGRRPRGLPVRDRRYQNVSCSGWRKLWSMSQFTQNHCADSRIGSRNWPGP